MSKLRRERWLLLSIVCLHLDLVSGVETCSCGKFPLESQLIRMVQLSYEKEGPHSEISAASDLAPCYSWTDLRYQLPGSILRYLKWSEPRVFVGRCSANPAICSVTFSGATGLDFVAGIPHFGPAHLHRNDSGFIEDALAVNGAAVHRYHKFYWHVYQALRSQVGIQLNASLSGCTQIHATGHSIGAALAALWQWENLEAPIEQTTFGQNLAWFGEPPDVSCRGRRFYNQYDPIPSLRPFVDAEDGSVIRHALVPAQELVDKGNGRWAVALPSSCDADVPFDPRCPGDCCTTCWYYNKRLFEGIAKHQASEYATAVDSALGIHTSLSLV